MDNHEAMSTPGQHQTSKKLKQLLDKGWKITNLWTNGENGDDAMSIVELDNRAIWVVDNAGAFEHPAPEMNFAQCVKAAEELGSDLNAFR
jgi:hypothetical protein